MVNIQKMKYLYKQTHINGKLNVRKDPENIFH